MYTRAGMTVLNGTERNGTANTREAFLVLSCTHPLTYLNSVRDTIMFRRPFSSTFSYSSSSSHFCSPRAGGGNENAPDDDGSGSLGEGHDARCGRSLR